MACRRKATPTLLRQHLHCSSSHRHNGVRPSGHMRKIRGIMAWRISSIFHVGYWEYPIGQQWENSHCSSTCGVHCTPLSFVPWRSIARISAGSSGPGISFAWRLGCFARTFLIPNHLEGHAPEHGDADELEPRRLIYRVQGYVVGLHGINV